MVDTRFHTEDGCLDKSCSVQTQANVQIMLFFLSNFVLGRNGYLDIEMLLTATSVRVPSVSLDTSALTSVTSGSTIGIVSTRPLDTWITASVVGQLAIFDVNTVVIKATLQIRNADSVRSGDVSWWTDTFGAVR